MFKKLFGFLFGSSGGSSCGCGCASASMHELEGFVEYVVKALVDYPDEVSIEMTETSEGAAIKIK